MEACPDRSLVLERFCTGDRINDPVTPCKQLLGVVEITGSDDEPNGLPVRVEDERLGVLDEFRRCRRLAHALADGVEEGANVSSGQPCSNTHMPRPAT